MGRVFVLHELMVFLGGCVAEDNISAIGGDGASTRRLRNRVDDCLDWFLLFPCGGGPYQVFVWREGRLHAYGFRRRTGAYVSTLLSTDVCVLAGIHLVCRSRSYRTCRVLPLCNGPVVSWVTRRVAIS